MPKSVESQNLTIGQILAEPIVNKFGQVLIPSGASLNEKYIQIIKIWAVKSLMILDNESEPADSFVVHSDQLRELAIQHFEKRIKWTNLNTLEKNLKEIAITNYIAKLMFKK